MNRIIELTDIRPEAWEQLTASSPVASWFQTREAYDFFASLTFLEAFGLGVETDGRLAGVVVGYVQKDGGAAKQYFSRRAIINGGPLLDAAVSAEALAMLLAALKERLKKKAIYIECRNYSDYGAWRPVFEQGGFGYEPHYDVQIDTPSVEAVDGGMNRNRRRNVRKATENGIVIDEQPTEADLEALYALLKHLYDTKVKTPLYPYEFFQKLRQLPASRWFVGKEPGGRVIGGMVCVALPGKALYAWYACGDDEGYRQLSPSVMVNYASISHAAQNGFPVYDFMGAGTPDDGGYGVRDFKLKFGGRLLELGRFKCICDPLLYAIGKKAVTLKKALK